MKGNRKTESMRVSSSTRSVEDMEGNRKTESMRVAITCDTMGARRAGKVGA